MDAPQPFHTVPNAAIARALREIADALDIEDENPFRVRAYRNAAQCLETLGHPSRSSPPAADARRSWRSPASARAWLARSWRCWRPDRSPSSARCAGRCRTSSRPCWASRGSGRRSSIDAHSTGELKLLRFGAGVARRAWPTRGHVLNTLPAGRLLKALGQVH